MDSIKPLQFTASQQAQPEKKADASGQDLTDRLVRSRADDLKLIPGKLFTSSASAATAVEKGKAEDEYPRPMTDNEKKDFKEYFPNINVEKAVVTAPATQDYNCISWTVGETQQWFWPPSMYPGVKEEEAFDKFYGSYGLIQAPQGEVARWRNNEGLTHGCVSGPDHGPRWESKCGSDLRIQHDLEDLEGDVYGHVDAYYTKKGDARTMASHEPVEISQEVLAGVKKEASEVEPAMKEKFTGLYNKWMDYRKSPSLRFSANPADYCKTDSFNEIAAMGPGAVPLLMEKIAGGDFFCLQAIEKIKHDMGPFEEALVPDLSKEEHNNSEQNRAALTLIRWYNEK
jgi:hypothetical protein